MVITIYEFMNTNYKILAILICLLIFYVGILIGISIKLISDYNKPQAIDVYRGKTTLQITYKDSIPQDTIVVFKN